MQVSSLIVLQTLHFAPKKRKWASFLVVHIIMQGFGKAYCIKVVTFGKGPVARLSQMDLHIDQP
jgi:hypothetical protein